MLMFDVLVIYLYGFGYVVMVMVVLMLVSGFDDLFIDVVYWVCCVWKVLVVYCCYECMEYIEFYMWLE